MMPESCLQKLLARHRAWAQQRRDADPDFFTRLGRGQNPWLFWIGCSDSRLAPEHLLDLMPSEAFVYRNVANIASRDDPGFVTALEFALNVLQVSLIAICGHEQCGGVQAVVEGRLSPAAKSWLAPLVQLDNTRPKSMAVDSTAERMQWLAQAHVRKQVEALAQDPIVQRTRRSRPVMIVGLFFRIRAGKLEIVSKA